MTPFPGPEEGLSSGKKNEPKPKLFGPGIFGWSGGLPREMVGAKKLGMSFETQENQTFWRDIPGFCRDIPELPEKFEKTTKLCSIFRPYLCDGISVLSPPHCPWKSPQT